MEKAGCAWGWGGGKENLFFFFFLTRTSWCSGKEGTSRDPLFPAVPPAGVPAPAPRSSELFSRNPAIRHPKRQAHKLKSFRGADLRSLHGVYLRSEDFPRSGQLGQRLSQEWRPAVQAAPRSRRPGALPRGQSAPGEAPESPGDAAARPSTRNTTPTLSKDQPRTLHLR